MAFQVFACSRKVQSLTISLEDAGKHILGKERTISYNSPSYCRDHSRSHIGLLRTSCERYRKESAYCMIAAAYTVSAQHKTHCGPLNRKHQHTYCAVQTLQKENLIKRAFSGHGMFKEVAVRPKGRFLRPCN